LPLVLGITEVALGALSDSLLLSDVGSGALDFARQTLALIRIPGDELVAQRLKVAQVALQLVDDVRVDDLGVNRRHVAQTGAVVDVATDVVAPARAVFAAVGARDRPHDLRAAAADREPG